MMGRQSGQLSMIVMDLAELIPNNHLLRRIPQVISFDFIYEILEPNYPSNGRPSIDPVSMFKMLLVGYLYGIKSERRLVEEIQLNIAYRWFCGFELADKIPDHSTFSKTRLRKWNESKLFQQAFLEIVRRCVKSGLVDGKELAADGTYLPANVSKDSWIETEVETELSMQSYLDRLDEELSKQPGFKKPPAKVIKKRRTTSKTDPDSGCINHGKKSGIGYLMETTVDCKCGIITGVDVYPANEKESLLVLRHLERQIQNGVPMQNIALDRGYDTGAVHRGLKLLGITGYIPAIQFSHSPEKYGFFYFPQEDVFCCPEGARLVYQRLNCSQTTGKYLQCYQVQGETCKHCKRQSVCFKQTGIRRRILGSSCYPASYRGHEHIGSVAYWGMMRLRKIWAEGSFSVLKREHCLSKVRKRGIPAVTEECLLSAMALNLKRMAKAIHAQESKKAAREKAKAVVAQLRAMKLKEAAKKIEDGVEETLTYADFPSEHWTRTRTNNAIERLNGEIRRRPRVVGCFPDGNSALMLVCARLRHVAGTQWGNKKYMNTKHLAATLEDASVAS